MDKDSMENNNLEKILKNYLKQENITIDNLSKESKIKLETIKKYWKTIIINLINLH